MQVLRGLATTNLSTNGSLSLDPNALPRLPAPPTFDAPFNPFIAGLLNASSIPGVANMTQEQVRQTQVMIIDSIIDAARRSAVKLLLTLMLGFVLELVVCAILLIQIRRYHSLALKGDSVAAKKIILPAFEPLLWMLCGITALYLVVYGIIISGDLFTIYVSRVSLEIMLAGTHLLLLIVLVFMLQTSLSLRALGRAVLVTIALASYTVPIVAVLDALPATTHQRTYYWIHMSSRLCLLVFLGIVFARPPSRASVRTIREYCVFVAVYVVLTFATGEAFHENQVQLATTLNYIATSVSLLCPIFVWRLLRADTEHWRGIGKRAVELQAVFRRNGGRVDERVSSQGLHVLIEMHRKFIIDFAHLELHEIIGTGDSASVFRGVLHSKKVPVAVKIYMPTTLTEETVAEFSHEAALCGALRHPNILKFYGLCVCPPNICLVTELCQGSLRDILEASVKKQTHASSHRRQQFLIDLSYMIDAARAVAYLHSFSPPFVHRDIQPSNFLVNMEGTVKLTDFGASRTLALRTNSGHQHHHEPSGRPTTTQVTSKTHPDGPSTTLANALGISATDTATSTPEYMAPEVIRAQHAGTVMYGEAAEVFALAMTMWDVLHPGMNKFPQHSTDNDTGSRRSVLGSPKQSILDRIVAGERPSLEADIPENLHELIESMWQSDPRSRPTMASVVDALELIQEEASAQFAHELMDDLGRRMTEMHVQVHIKNATRVMPPRDAQSSFAGTQAVEKLRMRDYVGPQSEAIRIGNLLMDAGFLHHVKHARSFEYSGSQYYFDEDHIQLCQPLAMMEDDETSVYATKARTLQREKLRREQRSVGSSSHENAHGRMGAMSNGSQVLLEHNTAGFHCPCRQLGQRLETERATRRRFRQRFKLFTEENVLTARLLSDDHAVGFAAFDDMGLRVSNPAK